MKFTTVQEAFNFYNGKSNEELEARAMELKGIIETDPDVDINSINIELTGIKQAKDNAQDKKDDDEKRSQAFKLIEGMNTQNGFNKDNAENTAEYRTAFLKTLLERPLNNVEKRAINAVMEKRAFNGGSNSGAVLPTQTLNEIITKARTQGGLLAECRQFNLPFNISIPIATPGAVASWHTEGAEVASEASQVANISFNGYEILKVISISSKVKTMSIDAFEGYLVDELTACVMGTLENAVINGTGTNQGTGLEKGVTWKENTNLKTVDLTNGKKASYLDFVGFVSLLKRGYSKGAKIAMNNKTLYNRVYGLVDANDKPIFIVDPKEDTVGKILGFSVVIDDNIADDVLFMGDYGKYLGYNLLDLSIEASTQSSFSKGLIDYRAIAIADCKPLVEEAFIKLKFKTA